MAPNYLPEPENASGDAVGTENEEVLEPRTPKKDTFRALECILCSQRYSREDILSGMYQLETFICSPCYAKMQRAPYEVSCFGKTCGYIPHLNKRLYGYKEDAVECRDVCPDRNICRRAVLGTV